MVRKLTTEVHGMGQTELSWLQAKLKRRSRQKLEKMFVSVGMKIDSHTWAEVTRRFMHRVLRDQGIGVLYVCQRIEELYHV